MVLKAVSKILLKLRRTQFIILMIAFAVFGLMPAPGAPSMVAGGDKLAHLAGWIVGAWSGLFAFPTSRWAILAGGLWTYSLAIELAQLAVPTRSFEASDLVANAAGICAGLLLARLRFGSGRT